MAATTMIVAASNLSAILSSLMYSSCCMHSFPMNSLIQSSPCLCYLKLLTQRQATHEERTSSAIAFQ